MTTDQVKIEKQWQLVNFMTVAVLANSEYAVVYLCKDYAPLAALVPFLMACTKYDLCIAHI